MLKSSKPKNVLFGYEIKSGGAPSTNSELDSPTSFTKNSFKIMIPALLAALSSPIIVHAAGVASTNEIPKQLQYLTDPTSEFKEEEEKKNLYLTQQKKMRKDWDGIISKLTNANDTESLLAVIKEMVIYLLF